MQSLLIFSKLLVCLLKSVTKRKVLAPDQRAKKQFYGQ